jgi:hypothetical protein
LGQPAWSASFNAGALTYPDAVDSYAFQELFGKEFAVEIVPYVDDRHQPGWVG